MPRFFFDTFDGRYFAADEEGQELESLGAAKAQAQRSVVEMAKDELPDGDHRSFVVSVRDETGGEVMRVALALVVSGDGAET
jgi:hypothetical protein